MLTRSLFTRSIGLLAATLGLALTVPAAAIDFVHVLVFANGHQVDVKTMPEVKGNTAYFTTTSGQEFYTRANNIDAQKTQELNAEREKAAVIAQEIQTAADNPSNSSLGALSEAEKKRRETAGTAQVVTLRDLEKSSKNDINSVERLPGAPIPEFKADNAGGAGESRGGEGGTTSSVQPGTTVITVPITMTPQPAPANETPAPANE